MKIRGEKNILPACQVLEWEQRSELAQPTFVQRQQRISKVGTLGSSQNLSREPTDEKRSVHLGLRKE